MDLRQLRYFVRTVELGSMGRAALELDIVTSALSQQIAKLESELSSRLLQRSSTGVVPTDAGLAFLHKAQLILRLADEAVQSAQQARLSGQVTVGMAPTTATVLSIPFLLAMRERYPDVRVRMVETLSGQLTAMLNARQLDIAIIFGNDPIQRWWALPLLEEHFYAIGRCDLAGMPRESRIRVADLANLPLVLPSNTHGLRALLTNAFARAQVVPNIVAEIDGVAMQLRAVNAGLGVTVHPGSATVDLPQETMAICELTDSQVIRTNLLVSLPDNELSPVGVGARVVLTQTARQLARDGKWPGVDLYDTPLRPKVSDIPAAP